MRAGRNADLSLTDNLPGAQFSSIEILVGAAVGTQSRAFQRDSREQSLIAGVRENLRVHDDVRSTLGRASLWTGGGGGIGAQLHLAGKQRSSAFGVHYQKHKVGGLAAQLKPDANSLQRIHGRGAPLSRVMLATSANHHATAVAATHSNRSLYHGGQYDHALGPVQQVLGNVVGDIQN